MVPKAFQKTHPSYGADNVWGDSLSTISRPCLTSANPHSQHTHTHTHKHTHEHTHEYISSQGSCQALAPDEGLRRKQEKV